MNSFTRSITTSGINTPALTRNGALTNSTSESALVDFFFVAGASRTMSESAITQMFARAYGENKELALRTALWARDARGGAGERETFRRILRWIELNHQDDLRLVLPRVPELGRWDDLLVMTTPLGRELAVAMIREALMTGNGLCAKWMPRKGEESVWLRHGLGFTPKRYRKTLVELTKVVETQMCAKEWDAINLEHVPSVASARYRKAFKKHMPEKFVSYGEKVAKGEAKVNAGAIFPYDVIKPLQGWGVGAAEIQIANGQWASLPDYVGEGSFLPVVDVSGSMTTVNVAGKTTALDVAVSLGLYLSERNKSAFKDIICTFSETPKLQRLNGPLKDRMDQLSRAEWGMSTNLQAALQMILKHAQYQNVPAEDMPRALLIISDMEFNSSVRGSTNYQEIKARYSTAGYEMPNVIFWNVNGRAGNSPVTVKDDGTALVSGFSPAIVKSVLGSKRVTPLDTVLETIMADRYALAA